MGYQALCVVHMEMFSQVFFENTLMIVISYSGKTRRLSEIVTTASKNNIPIISFIASKESPIYQDSTLPIIIGKYDSFLHDNSKPNFFFGETIIAFETLLFD